MARINHPLTENVWQALPTGVLIMTVRTEGASGFLQLNTAQDDDTSLIVSRGRPGAQFQQNDSGQTMNVKATGPGWVVDSDQ